MTGFGGQWQQDADRLAAESIAAGDPTGWFEQLYSAGAQGLTSMPWDREDPNPLLVEWAERDARTTPREPGLKAVVVGSGLGVDAAYLARLGYDTVGFDFSATAVRISNQRLERPGLTFQQADLLDLPTDWRHAYDLVVEIYTVQALPHPPRGSAIDNVTELVADGGRLLVVEFVGDQPAAPADGPPWPITRAEIDRFASGRLHTVRVELLPDPVSPGIRRWRAEFAAGVR
jgi:SAM-dependent methyltransferase